MRSEFWRLLPLFAVGVTWAVPFLFSAFVDDAAGVSSHPRLAHLMDRVQWPLVMCAPVAAVIGIIVVAVLSRRSSKFDFNGVTPVYLALIVVTLVASVLTDHISWPSTISDMLSLLLSLDLWLGLVMGPLLAVSLGVTWTVTTLAQHGRAVAIVWFVVWASFGSLVWFAGLRTSGNADDWGAGLLIMFDGFAVLLVSLVASIAAFGVAAVTSRLSDADGSKDVVATSSALIEQAHRAGSAR